MSIPGCLSWGNFLARAPFKLETQWMGKDRRTKWPKVIGRSLPIKIFLSFFPLCFCSYCSWCLLLLNQPSSYYLLSIFVLEVLLTFPVLTSYVFGAPFQNMSLCLHTFWPKSFECQASPHISLSGPTDNILYCRGQEPKKGTIPRVSKFVAKKAACRLKRFIKGLGVCRK